MSGLDEIIQAGEGPGPVEVIVTVPNEPGPVEIRTPGPHPTSVSAEAGVIIIGGGTSAPSDTATYTAGANLSGHRAVILGPGRQAFLADPTDPVHLGRTVGVTTGAAADGDNITVRRFGVMVEPSWSWNADLPIYVGPNGQLTQTPLAAGDGAAFVQRIGYATSPTSIVVDLSPDPIRFT